MCCLAKDAELLIAHWLQKVVSTMHLVQAGLMKGYQVCGASMGRRYQKKVTLVNAYVLLGPRPFKTYISDLYILLEEPSHPSGIGLPFLFWQKGHVLDPIGQGIAAVSLPPFGISCPLKWYLPDPLGLPNEPVYLALPIGLGSWWGHPILEVSRRLGEDPNSTWSSLWFFYPLCS